MHNFSNHSAVRKLAVLSCAEPINQPHPTPRHQSLRKALVALSATAVAALGTLSSSPASATALQPTVGSPEEFTLDLLAVLVAALGAFLLLLTGQRRKELPTIRER